MTRTAGLLFLLLLQSYAIAGADDLQAALAHASKNAERFNRDLIDLVDIPSISALPEHHKDSERAAQWLKDKLKSIGMKHARVMPTAGPHPVVYAEWLEAAGKPTILIYGHADVQPVDPVDLWEHEPFKAIIKDGYFWGRGVDDDKGGLLCAVEALGSWLQTAGALPVNVKILFEGQEEIGSPHLAAFLKENAELFKADYALSADGSQISDTQASITIGLRGALGLEITHQTLDADVHSGLKGGAVANPIHTLTELVAGFHDDQGRVAIEGFYRDVRAPTPKDMADMAAYPINEEAELKTIGALGPYGEAGFSTPARTWLRPTLEAVGFYGGFSGEGIKTIVPAKASVKLAARLVPDQDPEAVLAAVTRHVERHSSPLARVTVNKLGYFAKPFFMERDTIVNRAAAKVLEQVMSKPSFVRLGGTIPAAALVQDILNMDMTIFSFGLPTDNIHSPNEKLPVSMFRTGIEAYIRLLHEIGSLSNGSCSRDEL